jgi:endonuclease/exonuclease/phosphatase (EEP) superfamily protein YafD
MILIGAVLFLPSGATTTRAVWAMTMACMAYQAWWVLPYTRLVSPEVKPAVSPASDRTLRMVTANVLTPNREADKLIRLMREADPDIVVTLESDAWWESQMAALEEEYCHTVKCPLDNLYGMHVYSRLPLSDTHLEFLVEPDVPSIHALVTLRSGEKVRAHFLHPAPPSPTENPESTERDAELLIVAQSVADCHLPVVVTGDLNDVAWSKTTRLFRKISGLLDPRVGRGMFNTFHAQVPFMRWPLDHVFHSSHFRLGALRRLESFGSDHFPLFSELVLNAPVTDSTQEGLDADQADEALAGEKVTALDVCKDDVPTPGERST